MKAWKLFKFQSIACDKYKAILSPKEIYPANKTKQTSINFYSVQANPIPQIKPFPDPPIAFWSRINEIKHHYRFSYGNFPQKLNNSEKLCTIIVHLRFIRQPRLKNQFIIISVGIFDDRYCENHRFIFAVQLLLSLWKLLGGNRQYQHENSSTIVYSVLLLFLSLLFIFLCHEMELCSSIWQKIDRILIHLLLFIRSSAL